MFLPWVISLSSAGHPAAVNMRPGWKIRLMAVFKSLTPANQSAPDIFSHNLFLNISYKIMRQVILIHCESQNTTEEGTLARRVFVRHGRKKHDFGHTAAPSISLESCRLKVCTIWENQKCISSDNVTYCALLKWTVTCIWWFQHLKWEELLFFFILYFWFVTNVVKVSL